MSSAVGLVILRSLATLVSFLWLLFAARRLGPSEFGKLSTLLALSAIFAFIHQLGYVQTLTAYVARHPLELQPAINHTIRRRVALSTIAALAVVGAYGATFNWEFAAPLVFAASIISTAIYSSVTAGLRGINIIWPDGANELISRLIVAGFGIGLVTTFGTTQSAALAYSIGDVVSALVLGFGLQRWARRRARATLTDRAAFDLRTIAPLGAAIAISAITYRVDLWMVAAIRGDTEAGLYGAAFKILEGLLLPAVVIGLVGFSRMATLYGSELGAFLQRISIAALAVTSAAALAVSFGADPLIRLSFGTEFARTTSPLRWLMLAAVPTSVLLATVPAMTSHAARSLLVIASIAAVINIVLNAVLIPDQGATGAAIATVATQIVLLAATAVVLVRLARREPQRPESTRLSR